MHATRHNIKSFMINYSFRFGLFLAAPCSVGLIGT